MIAAILTVIFCALLYALKGGSGPYLFKRWAELRATNKITERLMDGKVISTIGAFLLALIGTADLVVLLGERGVPEYSAHFFVALKFAAAWLLSVAPSMGEEHGAIGRWKHAWGEYVELGLGRSYGVKKGIQRGVWIGAIMTLATGFIPYIWFSFLFVPCVFIGQELYYRVTGRDSWVLSEPIIGAVVYGVPTALYFMGA